MAKKGSAVGGGFDAAVKGLKKFNGAEFAPLIIVTALKGEWGRFSYLSSRDGKFGQVHKATMLAGNFRTDARKEGGARIPSNEVVEFFGCGMVDKAVVNFKNGQEFVLRFDGDGKMKQGKFKGKSAHLFSIFAE